MTQNPPIKYGKGRTYSTEEFELLNGWLKTHELVIEGTTVSHFELNSRGNLIPVPQTPILTVSEITWQFCQWNTQTRCNGTVTGSQGDFNLDMAGGRTIRAPDVAFTPTDTYRNLTQQQLLTFQGQPFHPTVVVEVEDVSASHKLEEITAKIKIEYFPA